MSRRRRRYRKRFECGHRGFGRFCHCCADGKKKREKMVLGQRQKRVRVQQVESNDAIDLRHLPRAAMEKARRVLGMLEEGANWMGLGEKLFHFDRSLMRIPVGYRYRLLCRRDQSGITPLAVMTHEAYNPVARNKKRA
jgi:hypothetical protein